MQVEGHTSVDSCRVQDKLGNKLQSEKVNKITKARKKGSNRKVLKSQEASAQVRQEMKNRSWSQNKH